MSKALITRLSCGPLPVHGESEFYFNRASTCLFQCRWKMLTSSSRLSRLLPFYDTSHHFSNREQHRPCRILRWLISTHRIIAPFFTSRSFSIERDVKHLRPLIEERRRLRAEYGIEYPNKPVSFLQNQFLFLPSIIRLVDWLPQLVDGRRTRQRNDHSQSYS